MSPFALRLITGALILCVLACKPSFEVQQSKASFIRPSASSSEIPPDSGSVRIAAPYRVEMEVKMNRVLARSGQPMEKGQPESVLGNFVADLCFAAARQYSESNDLLSPDFCVLNNGGLRSSLPDGDLLLRYVYELMPFDNELVVIEMDGIVTRKVLDYIAMKGGVPVSGLTMSLGNGIPAEVLIGGRPFDPAGTYRVVTSDYLAGGGDAMEMFDTDAKRYSSGIMVRDAIIQYLEEAGKHNTTVVAKKDGRITK